MGAPEASQFPMLASGLTNTMSSQTPDDQMVQQLFQQLMQQTQQQAPPHPYEPPPQASTPAALGSILLGSLGSALNWQRPDLAQRPVDELLAQKKELDQAHAENVQQLNDFENKRDIMMKQISLKRLDYAMQRAKQEDNQQAIAAITQAKGELSKQLQEMKDSFAAAQQDRKYQELLTNAMTTLGQRFALENDLENHRVAGGFSPKGSFPPTGGGIKVGGIGGTSNPKDFSAQKLASEERQINQKFPSKQVKATGVSAITGKNAGVFGTAAHTEDNPNQGSSLKTLYATYAMGNGSGSPIAARKLGRLVKTSENITDAITLAKRLKDIGLSGDNLDTAMSGAGFAPPKKK